MRFVVLMKQVPANLSVSMNADYTMNRQQMQKITNPADMSALAMALEWKARMGGDVICVTMGPASAADCLREAAMAGADRLYHVCDPAIAGSDTFVTATVLSEMVRKIGDVDLVFCGRHSVDGETGQVGAEVAVMLDYACLSQVLWVEQITDATLECVCLAENGTERYQLRRPAVVCVCECKSAVVMPSLAAMRRAKRMPVETVTLADLGLTGMSGRRFSPTKVSGVHRKEHSHRHTVWLKEEPARAVAELLRRKNGEGEG